VISVHMRADSIRTSMVITHLEVCAQRGLCSLAVAGAMMSFGVAHVNNRPVTQQKWARSFMNYQGSREVLEFGFRRHLTRVDCSWFLSLPSRLNCHVVTALTWFPSCYRSRSTARLARIDPTESWASHLPQQGQ